MAAGRAAAEALGRDGNAIDGRAIRANAGVTLATNKNDADEVGLALVHSLSSTSKPSLSCLPCNHSSYPSKVRSR